MHDSAAFHRHARRVTMSLIATVVLPLVPVIWQLQVHACVTHLQSARDRLDALRERLVEPRSISGASMVLAEDLVLRRMVSELLDDIRAKQEWCAGADFNTLNKEFDAWFESRTTSEPFVHLDGVLDAAVYRSRISAERAHWAVIAGCGAALFSALFGWLSLRKLVRIRQLHLAASIPVSWSAKPVASASPPFTSMASNPPIRMPLPPALTPPVFRPIAAADVSPSPGRGLPAVAPGPLTLLQGRVLVIEDNPINQRVTQRQLMELGLGVEVVATAEIGLARLVHESYDAVLMDLQLPGIDGLTATRRWRAQEAAEGRRRLPIIAITANAMGTDREACYSAGMDGYQAKPARLDDLHRALVRWVGTGAVTELRADDEMSQRPITPMPRASPQEASQLAAPSLGNNPTLAMLMVTAAEAALSDPYLWEKLRSETAQTDPRLLEELMADLRLQAPANLAEMDDAVQRADHERVRSAAHRLKGSAGMLGLPRLSACAKSLEFAAKVQDQEAAISAFADLRKAYSQTLEDPAVMALR